MIRFLKKKIGPIGIDFGLAELKMLQLLDHDNHLEILAAEKVPVPPEMRQRPESLMGWYAETIRESLARGVFKGKKVVTNLSEPSILVQHMRLAKMDPKQLKKAIVWESQDLLPFPTVGAMLRHITVGDVYEQEDHKLEVILLAASRQSVWQHVRILEQLRLEVESIQDSASSLLKGFSDVLAAGTESDQPVMFVDLGSRKAKVVIAHGSQMKFCRKIDLLSDGSNIRQDENVEVAVYCGVGIEKNENRQMQSDRQRPLANLNTPDTRSENTSVRVDKLAAELRSCIRYHDMMFEKQRVGKVVFVGGRARDKTMCQELAKELGLPAQLGDPVGKLWAKNQAGFPNGQRNEIHPEWAVVFGLSLGHHKDIN